MITIILNIPLQFEKEEGQSTHLVLQIECDFQPSPQTK